jgi:hypothetical protein
MKRQNNLPMAALCQMATSAELRSLYISIAKRLHPDRDGGKLRGSEPF